MALEKYREKRDFTRSPEPAGNTTRKSPAGRTPRFFCVQKHLASHLHYDLRLEHNGVLLSWAVPKGPAIDPTIKRLAMHVEDHPVEYGEFEGVIPSGYGAGIVMLWDRGTWTPEVDDVDAALAKGDLKLTLDGYKLKGSWALVRTRGWGGRENDGRSWLLIKHKDNWAGPIDIAEFAPLSVKSGGDFADILADENPDIWTSNRPAETGDTGKLFQTIIARAKAMRGRGIDQGPRPEAEGPKGKKKGQGPRPKAQGQTGKENEQASRPKAKSQVASRQSPIASRKTGGRRPTTEDRRPETRSKSTKR